ncbi:uncharacterized protein LOC108218346 [Daucus carota subsp. sativus]|uniref:uncharacterized protein LOC108218346 n=1 Tax=Daucus carota subsp. sativus TaxID=79200 RepID=UPI003082F4BA
MLFSLRPSQLRGHYVPQLAELILYLRLVGVLFRLELGGFDLIGDLSSTPKSSTRTKRDFIKTLFSRFMKKQVEMLRVEKLAQEMEEKIDPKVRENVKALVSKLVEKKSRLQD